MDELNLSEIEKKLNAGFSAGERIIFWYDADGSFEDSVDSLDLGNVKILHLTDRNAFRAKMLLEHDDPVGSYLVYAPFAKPPVKYNHLEDTLLYSKEFHADKMSLIAADLGLPGRVRGFLSDYAVFFGVGANKLTAAGKKAAAGRTNQFIERAKELDLSTADEDTIALIILCTAADARNTTVDDLLYAVLTFGDLHAQEIIHRFENLQIADRFWKICEQRFGYSDPKPTLLKLAMSLFSIDTFKDHLTQVPNGWKLYAQDDMKGKASNTAVLLENMMNNVLYQNKFDRISEEVSEELNADEVLSEIPLEQLLSTTSFRVVDELLIKWMIGRETGEDLQAEEGGFSIPELCRLRLRTHFGAQEKDGYQALLAGYELLHAVGYTPKDSFSDLIDSYVTKDYQIDQEYRRYITSLDQMEDSSGFEKLSDLLENIYSNEYLGRVVYNWNLAYMENGSKSAILLQKDFYSQKVDKVKEKVAVIISDAFRYEAAAELAERFKADPNMDVDISPMLTSLPSITSVGMAQLLPHEKIAMTEGSKPEVMLDESPTSSTAYREKILFRENAHSAAIDYDSLKSMKSKELKDFSAGKEVIYVYHNRIDATGEAMKTENSVFAAVSQSIDEIFNIVRTLSKSGNIYRFLVTSDHGFIYTRRKLNETDKLDNFAGNDAFTDRRFIIDRKKAETGGVYSVSLGDALGNSDNRYISLAKGMSVFRCGGGMNYVHGGASPQEMIIPCIFVKTQKGLAATEDVKFTLITDVRKITGLKVKLDFYQDQPISDKVKAVVYRIDFETENGELVSNSVLYKADSKSEKPGDRMVSLHFDLKRRVYGSDQKYFLKIRKDETGSETESRQVIMDLPFTDDFEFDF